jgi:hypothetical protein
MSPRLPNRLAAVVAVACSGLAGCSLLSPAPTWELVKATGSVTAQAIGRSPSHATDTVHYGDAPVKRLCIEFNRNAPLPDLVPALQAELRGLGVASRVYEAGAGAASGADDCEVWLRYAASVDWDTPPFGDTTRPYLSAASMSLQRSGGALLASSGYRVDDAGFGASKWATTRTKLAPVVRALIQGFE